jgi:hypothetical protein
MRDYDPTTGCYLQADPLGLVDGASVYGYALQNPGRYVDPRGEQANDPWPTTHGRPKSFICGNYRIVCESDPFKGRHCSWSEKNGSGLKHKGRKTCIKENGQLCEGSAPPPKTVLKCLQQKGYCPVEDEPAPFMLPALTPLILPSIQGQGEQSFGGGGGYTTMPEMTVIQ